MQPVWHGMQALESGVQDVYPIPAAGKKFEPFIFGF
jgi:hypothetical protein